MPQTTTDDYFLLKLNFNVEAQLQTVAKNICTDIEGRKFPSYLPVLHTKTLNECEMLPRDHLISSSKIVTLYCAPCQIFLPGSQPKQQISSLTTT